MRITELDDEGSDDLCGREIVRVKAKRALVGAGARILFYPTLLYNVFRNKLQAEFRWWDEVDQFLLLGAVPFPKDVPRLRELGVRAVITLNEPYETLVPSSLYKAHGIDHLVIPTRDYLFAPSLVDICCAVDFIHSNSSRGRITYVHCKAGRGRSTTIVLCYLVEYKHMTPTAALEYVRSRRPRVLLAPSQWRAVQEYSKCKLEFPAIVGWMLSSPPAGDEVLITEADLEGYGTCEDHCRALCAPSHRVVQAGPIILRLTRPTLPTGDEVLITDADFAPPSPPAGDEVLITDADLEGYGIEHYICNDDLNTSSHRIVRSRPMIAKLSCLFASLKFSGGSFPPVVSRPPEIRAC